MVRVGLGLRLSWGLLTNGRDGTRNLVHGHSWQETVLGFRAYPFGIAWQRQAQLALSSLKTVPQETWCQCGVLQGLGLPLVHCGSFSHSFSDLMGVMLGQLRTCLIPSQVGRVRVPVPEGPTASCPFIP